MEHPNEQLVFSGKRYRVYQWEQELFNGDFTTFERIEHTPSVTILAILDNKFVIQKQIQPPPFRKRVLLCTRRRD